MNLILQKGSWILINNILPIEYPIPPLSLWYAVPTGQFFWEGENSIDWFSSKDFYKIIDLSLDIFNKNPNELKSAYYRFLRGNKEFSDQKKEIFLKLKDQGTKIEQQVKIVTPWGQCNIQPHEYNKISNIKDYIKYVETGDASLQFLTKSNQLKGKLKEQIFYLRTRGINYTDALMLCANNINSQYLFWIKMSNDIINHFFDFDNYDKKIENYNIKLK